MVRPSKFLFMNHLLEKTMVLVLKPCLLFFWVIVSTLLHRNTAAYIPGFISIDCGANEDHTDNTTGIFYQSDKNLVTTGVSELVSSQISGNIQPHLKNVRAFPQGTRNCYALKPELGRNNKYLIRASFLYGNYDKKNQTPVFDLYIGSNFWWTVDWENGYAEIIHVPSTNYINICLLNTNKGTPYISALEIRHLENSIYQINSSSLVTIQRYDLGGKSNIRFPNDNYDRIWNPLYDDFLVSNSTNSTIIPANGDTYKIPNQILRTASYEHNASCPLSYIWTTENSSSQFSVYFHLAEIQKLEAKKQRKLMISMNGDIVSQNITLEYLTPVSLSLNALPDSQGQLQFSIFSLESDLPPILNGFEIYAVKEMNNSSSTVSGEVDAIMDIKQMYRVIRNWQGDPCVPRELSWQGLNCSNTNTSWNIISLNLSSSNLVGKISDLFSNFQEIVSLDLSHNELTGPVPKFLTQLPNLRILNISGNKLKGSVPVTLLRRSEDGTLVLSAENNPGLCLSISCKKDWTSILIPVLASSIGALLFLVILGALLIYRKRKQEKAMKTYNEGLLRSKNRQCRFSEIVSMTENFKTVIGEGGFGKVYIGTLENNTKVAVKLLSASSRQGYNEFRAEARILTIVHHRNLVSLIGYCDEGENKALIYEYMANGNLHERLSETNMNVLNWTERLQIAVDAAQGLEYLHNGCKPPIIHRDMKPSNILLNERMQAKIADFGLSRAFVNENDSHLTTGPAGTFGYLDPEVHSSGNFSKKSDVYSFGIVLLELITGRPAIIKGQEYNTHIIQWVRSVIESAQGDDIQDIFDPRLQESIENDSAQKFLDVAILCTMPTSIQRPDMSHVLVELMECLDMVQGRTEEVVIESSEKVSYNSIGSDSALSPR